MTAMGQANALAVLAVGEKGAFLHAPDMYMEKLIVGPEAKGSIDLNLPLADNLRNVALKLGKPLSQLTVTTLAKPRHDACIAEMQQLGVKVFAIPDATSPHPFSPACRTAKLTCCTASAVPPKA